MHNLKSHELYCICLDTKFNGKVTGACVELLPSSYGLLCDRFVVFFNEWLATWQILVHSLVLNVRVLMLNDVNCVAIGSMLQKLHCFVLASLFGSKLCSLRISTCRIDSSALNKVLKCTNRSIPWKLRLCIACQAA